MLITQRAAPRAPMRCGVEQRCNKRFGLRAPIFIFIVILSAGHFVAFVKYVNLIFSLSF